MSNISKLEWPKNLVAQPEMSYESLAPLYYETQANTFGGSMAFAVSCTNYEPDNSGVRGCIHKMVVNTAPTFAQASIKITHEVHPNQGACSQIIAVNDKLRVACFDRGSIVPISNFGPGRTFHCDVRGRLHHHSAPINCIASDADGVQLASGSTRGEIALYQVCNEAITFISRTHVSSSFVTGLTFLKSHGDINLTPNTRNATAGDRLLIYSTQDGRIGFLDTRCDVGEHIDSANLITTEPRVNLSTLCYVDSLPGTVIFFGTAHGQLIAIDLRFKNRYLHEQNLPEDNCIRRMKQITIQSDGGKTQNYVAYTNETNSIKIIDADTMQADKQWTCDRPSNGIVKDICQVGKSVVTCGLETSIGSWTWDDSKQDQPQ